MHQYCFHCPICGGRYLEWEDDSYCCVRCGTPLSQFVEDSRLTSVPADPPELAAANGYVMTRRAAYLSR